MSYKSIKENVIETIVINKSEFISHLYQCHSQDEAEQIISDISEKYSDANHNCYAYVIGKNKNIKKCSDDGEPSQTAGMPILNVLEHNDITDVVCVVTRYFGGIKLGAGGLVRAYSKSCSTALDKAEVVIKVPASICEIHMDYKLAPKVEYYLNDNDIKINNKNYYDKVVFTISVSNSSLDRVQDYIINASSNQAIFEVVDSIYITE
jgi:uncharacterized YigZ family protein